MGSAGARFRAKTNPPVRRHWRADRRVWLVVGCAVWAALRGYSTGAGWTGVGGVVGGGICTTWKFAVVCWRSCARRTTPEGVDGKVTGEPLPRPQLRILAQVDGRVAEVLYAGGAPGLVAGVLQMNVRIPLTARSGAAVPLRIGWMDGPFGVEPSESVTIAIQ